MLAEALARNRALAVLDLRANGIRDKGAQHIARALAANATLTHLSLEHNGISEDGAAFLADALEHRNASLTVLALRTGNSAEESTLSRIERRLELNLAAQSFVPARAKEILAAALQLSAGEAATSSAEALLEDACAAALHGAVCSALESWIAATEGFPNLRKKWGAAGSIGLAVALSTAAEHRLRLFRDKRGRTFLHFVSSSQSFPPEAAAKMVRMLVSAGLDPNARETFYALPPLFHAASPAVTEALAAAGADLRASDCFGLSSERWIPPSQMALARKAAPPTTDLVVLVSGDSSCPSLPWTAFGAASQFIHCATCAEERMHGLGSSQDPWWSSTLSSKLPPVECFPTIRVPSCDGSFIIARLCDATLLSKRYLSEIEKDARKVFLLNVISPEKTDTLPVFVEDTKHLRELFHSSPAALVGLHSGSAPFGSKTKMAPADVELSSLVLNANLFGTIDTDSPMSFVRAVRWCVEYSTVFPAPLGERRLPFARVFPQLHSPRKEIVLQEHPLPHLVEDSLRRAVKIIVLGFSGSGKSSLLRFLSDPSASSSATTDTTPTVGADEVHLEVDPELTATAFDFSGRFLELDLEDSFFTVDNTVLMIVVDGSDTRMGRTPVQRLQMWLDLVGSRIRWPVSNCKIIVVYTKRDVVQSQYAEPMATDMCRKTEVAASYALKSDNAFLRNVENEFVFVSSKTGEGMVLLQDLVVKYAHSITMRTIPHAFNDVSLAAFNLRRRYTPFTTLRDFKAMVAGEITANTSQPGFWEPCLEFLRESGHMVFSRLRAVDDSTVLCAHTVMLSKALETLATRLGPPIASEPEVLSSLRSMLVGAVDPTQIRLFAEILRQMRFFLPAPDSLLIPLSAQHCDAAPLPRIQPSEIPEEVLRLSCVRWTCGKCGNVLDAAPQDPAPYRCSVCFATDSYVLRCAKRDCAACSKWMQKTSQFPLFVRRRGDKLVGVAEGELFSLESADRCDCFVPLPLEVRFIAEQLVPKQKDVRLSLSLWSKLLGHLRERTAQRFPVAKNAAVLNDCYGNLIAITLIPESGTPSSESWVSGPLVLRVVASGVAPWLWKQSAPELCALGAFEPLCPRCAQLDTFATLTSSKVPLQLGEARSATPAGLRTLKKEKWQCPSGHVLTKEEQSQGVPAADAAVEREGPLWMPRLGKIFITETDRYGRWSACPVCAPTDLIFTELQSEEQTPARCAEYNRARAMFYSFLGQDLGSHVELLSVVFVHCLWREDAFLRRCQALYPGRRVTPRDTRDWDSWAAQKVARIVDCGQELGWQGMSESLAHAEILRRPSSSSSAVRFALTAKRAVETAHGASSAETADDKHSRPCLLASWVLPAAATSSTSARTRNTVFLASSRGAAATTATTSQHADDHDVSDAGRCLPRYIFFFREASPS